MSRSQRDFREDDGMSRPSPSICWPCNRLVDRVFASMLKIPARYSQTGLGLSARPNGSENLKKPHVIETEFQPGPKNEREHAHWLCFRTSVNFLTEICVLRPGWNWAHNHNKVSARWAERNFSPGWNSPCNQALSCKKASANVLAQISTQVTIGYDTVTSNQRNSLNTKGQRNLRPVQN